MSEAKLINRMVYIGFSEPWELSGKLEKDNTIGTITDIGRGVNKYYGNKEEYLIIRLKKGFQYDGLDCKYFVASPRLEGTTFIDLLNGNEVDYGFIRITKEQANSDNRFDTSWWRGGGAFTATIKLA